MTYYYAFELKINYSKYFLPIVSVTIKIVTEKSLFILFMG